jgi:hypothetical protein
MASTIERDFLPAPKAHAKFSASGAERWLNCPASVRLSEGLPSISSKHAEEGTKAHELLETFLKNGLSKLATTKSFLSKTADSEMLGHAEKAARWIFSQIGTGTLLCETKVDLSFVSPNMFGTVDAAIVDEFGVLHVIDFKYGVKLVDPKENPQLIYYALGIAKQNSFNFESVRLTVVQPRAGDSFTRSWDCEVGDLRQWEEKFRDGVSRCEDTDAKPVEGKWCFFCPAKIKCPLFADAAFKQAKLDFSPVSDAETLGTVAELNISEGTLINKIDLPAILRAAPKIRAYLNEVEERAEAMLGSYPDSIPGFTLAHTTTRRVWGDEAKTRKSALKLFGKKALTEPELKSPAQLEKISPKAKEFVASHVSVLAQGLKVVPIEDAPQRVLDFAPALPEPRLTDNKAAKRKSPKPIVKTKTLTKTKKDKKR